MEAKKEKKIDYDLYQVCPKCGGMNSTVVMDAIEGVICECETKCDVCSHKDYWAYGWYQP